MTKEEPIVCPEGFHRIDGASGVCLKDAPQACPCVAIGNPIQPGGGAKIFSATDFTAGTGPLSFSRTYNSFGYNPPGSMVDPNAIKGVLGRMWRTPYDTHVFSITNSTYVTKGVVRADGTIKYFRPDGSEYPHFAGTPVESLVTNADGSSIYTTGADQVETYDAQGRLTSIWDRSSFRQTLAYGSNNRLQTVTDSRGRSLDFFYTVADDASQTVLVTTPAGQSYIYAIDPLGNLTSVGYPNGTSRIYLYEDPNSFNAITGVVDENATRYETIDYDTLGRAVDSYLAPNSASGSIDRNSFTYVSANKTKMTDALGQQRTLTFSITNGVANFATVDVLCTACGSDARLKQYDTAGYPSSTTDFDGNITLYSYDDTRGLETSRTEASNATGADSPKRTIQTDWHPTFRVPTERRTFNVHGVLEAKTQWTYNTRGQPLAMCRIDPADPADPAAMGYTCGGTVTPPANANVRRTTYNYCEQADVDADVCPMVGLLLSSNGPRSPAAAGMSGTDDITAYIYYQTEDPGCATGGSCTHRHGDLWKKTDALGNVTEYVSYDKDGRLIQTKDANGTVTDFAYSPRGWFADRIVRANVDGTASAGDATTHMDYDAVGNVIKVTQPDGSYLAYTYDDAHRFIKMTDNLGNSIDYCPGGVGSAECLDAAGNRRVEEVKDPTDTIRRSVHHVYDQLSHLQQTLNAAQQPIFDAADGYDGNGNLTQSVDGRGVMTQQQYDPLNRLIATIQDVGGTDPGTANATTHYSYDAMDQLRSVTDPSGLVTNYTYDGLGDLTQLDSPDTGTTHYHYDSAGNRTSQTDARGVTTTYTYDALNRLVATHYPDSSLEVTYAYGQPNSVTGCTESYLKGRLTTLTDSTGSTTWCYDRRGNPTDKIVNVDGYTIHMRYSYDLADHLMSIDYGTGGSIVTYGRDADGRIDMVSASLVGRVRPLVTNVDYLPFGPATSWTFASGATLVKAYDRDYQISDVVGSVAASGDALNLHFATDTMGNITAMGGQPAVPVATERYGYDAMNRLTAIAGGGQVRRSFTYNPTGDRLSDTQAGQSPTLYDYMPQTHHLVSIGGATRTVDAAGYTTSRDRRVLSYNDAGRLENVGGPLSFSAQYNALDQRVNRHVWAPGIGPGAPTGTTLFTYLEDGRLAAEYQEVWTCLHPLSQPGCNYVRALELAHQYVWANSALVAVSTAGQQTQWNDVYTDHLGTPRAIVGPQGAVLWRWPWTDNAFGEAPAQWDPDGNGVPFNFNLRYPGQYYDAETGLHYNYFRDYEPATGRYVESDPIGLRGGIGTYGYVLARPLDMYDALGLQTAGAPPAPAPWWWDHVWPKVPRLPMCLAVPNPIVLGIIAAVMPNSTAECDQIDYPPDSKCSNGNDDQCDYQYYEVDIPVCRGVARARGAAKARRCYASAADRYAACLAGRPMPPLDSWNN